MLLLVLPLAFATPDYIFKQNEEVDLKIPCYDENNNLCDNNTLCYLTINNPKEENIIKNASMDYQYNYYNYTINHTNLNLIGDYSCFVNCIGNYSGFTSFIIEITPTGFKIENNLLAITFGFLILITYFFIIGYINKTFGMKFICNSLALVELIMLVGIFFINESSGSLINLLKINFYVMAILGFGIGMISMFMHSLRIAVPEETMDEDDSYKWEGNTNEKW